MGERLNARVDDIARIWPSEMGSTHAVAQAFAGTIGGVYEYYADLADTFPFEERFDNPRAAES